MCFIVPIPRRSTLGPRSASLAGNQVFHRCAGSTTWSSTLMIFGSSAIRREYLPLEPGLRSVENASMAHGGAGDFLEVRPRDDTANWAAAVGVGWFVMFLATRDAGYLFPAGML